MVRAMLREKEGELRRKHLLVRIMVMTLVMVVMMEGKERVRSS